ncbi:phosphatidate cytidylyltransferase [Nakamurella antarctica]|uniref:Phosphatidate cytidylyltransferase n=1 Tax=Nakamurella antarctica TaxID=1902245 RepID=A0A3G8ZM34_9ACTN|nr:phosphatidate cytidylyltransferase [Nakamurella antarctica]AZI57837.1 phosphatidate cytidylyltransferase [Nakamurella antarctica]
MAQKSPRQPDSSPAVPSKAGRNLPVAFGVALLFAAVIIPAVLLWRWTFVAIIIAAVAASVWELRATLASAVNITISWEPIVLGGAATLVLTWFFSYPAQIVGISLTVLACMIWRLPGGQQGYLRDLSASVFVVVYVVFFATFAVLMAAPHDGSYRILTFLILVVSSDTGGYAAGVLFGKHPMAPSISPKKSWEGFAGSVVTTMAAGAICLWLMLETDWWRGLIIGAVIALIASVGDLIESLIKRDIGVKDMGTLLPGHGGVMDRMDSLLPSAVAAWMLLTLLVPVI